jgi:plastocyanin
MSDNERTAHAKTQTFGLALISAAGIVAVILTLVLFDGDDIAFLLVPAAAAIGAAIVTWRFDRQSARALGLVGTILSLGMFFLAFGLFHIFSPIEFIVALAYVSGFFISIVAGIGALVASRKDDRVPAQSSSRLRSSVVGIIGIAAVVSVTGFLLSRESVDESEAAGATVLEMVKFEFDPGSSALPVDGKLLIQNSDPFVHDFTLDDLDIAMSIGPGSEALLDLTGLTAGTYDYICSLHSDGETGMVGTIVISG